MTKKEIVKAIKKMDNVKVIKYWNEYVGETCLEEKDYAHVMVYTNNSAFFNSFFTPFDAVLSVKNSHYDENDNYVVIGEGNKVQSFTDWNDAKSPVDIDILADWLFDKVNKILEQ